MRLQVSARALSSNALPGSVSVGRMVQASVTVSLMLVIGCTRSEPPASSPVSSAPATAPVSAAPAPSAPPATGPGPVNEKGAVDYGTTQPVATDANPQATSVAEALKNRNHPERLSPIIAPAPFDRVAYLRNPQAYLNVIEPGRVFQVAQPGPDVPRIAPLSPLAVAIPQGSSTPLIVRVPAGMPVTFTSFDLGRFAENQLTSITVAANDQGVAQATFVGASGTISGVNILAACPVTAGQLTYHIDVTQLP